MVIHRSICEPQPEFPLLDLTDNNKQDLTLEVTNHLLIEPGLGRTQQPLLVYKVNQPAIAAQASEVRDGYYIDAIGHGTALLAAMSASVGGLGVPSDGMLRVSTAAGGLLTVAHHSRIDDEALHMLQQFEEQMPHTAEVIEASSERHFGGLTKYALLGAALERQLILGLYE